MHVVLACATEEERAMRDDGCATAADRRTVLAGAAAGDVALAGLALDRPARAASPAAGGFDPMLAGRLQQVLDDVVAGSHGQIPGVTLHVERAGGGSWSGTSGLGRVHPQVAMRPGDRFRAGSIVKPFIAARVLQLVECGRFTLDTKLPAVLPTEVVDR